MLERLGYERFGLVRNPFQDVASETLTEAEALHVAQHLDHDLEAIKGQVLDGARKAVVGLSGPMGSGKTHRLRVAEAEAVRLGAFCVLRTVADAPSQVAALARDLRLAQAKKPFFAPPWLRSLRRVERRGARADPEEAGAAIAEALNACTPAFLLVNDAQNLLHGDELPRFLQMLNVLVNKVQPGVLVLLAGHPVFFEEAMRRDPALFSRFDRIVPVAALADEEAQELLARRLPQHRVVEGIDPLYPFTPDAVHELNVLSGGNPRTLLKLADVVLGVAAARRGFQIVPETVRQAVRAQAGAAALLPPSAGGAGDAGPDVPAAPGFPPPPASTNGIEHGGEGHGPEDRQPNGHLGKH